MNKTLSALPFKDPHEQVLSDLTFNSNFSCKDNSMVTSLTNYNNVEKLEMCKIMLKEFESLYSND